jgi:hypothetical protein
VQLPAGGRKDVVIRSEAGAAPLDVRQSGPLLVIAGVHPRLVWSAGGRTLEILHPQRAITTGAQPPGP